MKLTFKRIAFASVVVLMGTSIGCDNDDNDNNNDASDSTVVEVAVEDSIISVGQASVVRVNFSFDGDEVLQHGQNVALVVHLPNGVVFLPESGDLDVPVGDDDAVGAEVVTCPAGDSYVVFNLDGGDLDVVENPGGNADARLTFTVTALAVVSDIIEARADNLAVFACGTDFMAEAAASIEAR